MCSFLGVVSDQRLPLLKRVFHTAVGSLAIGETVSVRALAASRDVTVDPLARAVMTCLVADESIHSRFGWIFLQAMWPDLPERGRERIAAWLPDLLDALRVACPAADAVETDEGSPFGYLGSQSRREIFVRTLEDDILVPFERIGLPARRCWQEIEG